MWSNAEKPFLVDLFMNQPNLHHDEILACLVFLTFTFEKVRTIDFSDITVLLFK